MLAFLTILLLISSVTTQSGKEEGQNFEGRPRPDTGSSQSGGRPLSGSRSNSQLPPPGRDFVPPVETSFDKILTKDAREEIIRDFALQNPNGFLSKELLEKAVKLANNRLDVGAIVSNAKSEPYEKLTAAEVVEKCLAISPLNRSPPSGEKDSPVRVLLQLNADRFIGIDDVSATISMSAVLHMYWAVPNCVVSKNLTESVRVGLRDIKSVWHPNVELINNNEDMAMQGGSLDSRAVIIVDPIEGKQEQNLTFRWKRAGIFTASCHLDLEAFPFDVQHCGFVFKMEQPTHLVEIIDVGMQNPRHQGSNTWKFVAAYAVDSSRLANITSSEVAFYYVFKRNPTYYIQNLLAQSVVLVILGLCSLIIHAKNSDRALFCVYLYIAFSVCQQSVLSKIPTTSQHILLDDLTLMLEGTTGLLAAYGLFSHWLTTKLKSRTCRLIDLGIFCFFLLVLGLVSWYTYAQSQK